MNVWPVLLEKYNNRPTATITTTLLGRVPIGELPTGEYVGIIPDSLQRIANKNGFYIESACYKTGQYTLRFIGKNNNESSS